MDNTAEYEALDKTEVAELELVENLHFKNKENGIKRRKSSVLFNPVLEDFEPVGVSTQSESTEKDLTSVSYHFNSTKRSSIFSRISEMSFQSISTKYQWFFLCCSCFIIFLMGVVIGALLVKVIVCFKSSKGQVSYWTM